MTTNPGRAWAAADLSLIQAAALLSGSSEWDSRPVPAASVPSFVMSDGPHGVRRQLGDGDHLGIAASEKATCFPTAATVANSWDPALAERMGEALGREARALGVDVLLGPGLNIKRSPLCGRNFEYYSEDPLLTGLTAAAYVRGVQSRGVSACPKHLACNNQETMRWVNDSRVSQRALREIYLRGFRICVEQSRPRTIMTSYNKINGQWAHYNYDLVTTILRGEWGYEGLVITDWWMRYAPDPLFEALADSATRVRAQVDVLMPGGRTYTSTRAEGHDDAVLACYDPEDASGEHLTLGELQRTARNVLRMALTTPALRRSDKGR